MFLGVFYEWLFNFLLPGKEGTLSSVLECFSPEMRLNLLQCPVPGLRDEQDAEEKAQGGHGGVDPEHSIVTNQLYQVGVARNILAFLLFLCCGAGKILGNVWRPF